MATKSGLISAINAQITAVITEAKHRLSMLEVVNELFPTTTTQIIQEDGDNFNCNLRYKKIGNIVYIDGTITSNYDYLLDGGIVMITIPNSMFYAKTGQNTQVITDGSNGGGGLINFTTSSIISIGSVSPFRQFIINAHYQTND